MATSELHGTMEMTYARVMAAEWLKLKTQRSFFWATITALVVTTLMSALGGYLLLEQWATDPAEAFALATSIPSTSIAFAGLIFGLGLCIWLAGEFVSGSNYLTLTAVPQRNLVFSARLGLVTILSMIFGGVTALIGSGSALLFVGPDRMAPVVADGAFWASAIVTMLLSVSTALFYFAAAILTRKSLPAVGLMAVLFFVMPNIAAYVSLFLDAPRALSLALGILPGSLTSELLAAGSPDGSTKTFTPLVAAVLLVSWVVLLVSVSARRFARYE